MTITVSINGEKIASKEIGKISLMSDVIVTTCNNVRRRLDEQKAS